MGKVYGLWPLELKPGVDGADVEQFARDLHAKYLPLPGVRFALLKGTRGDNVGQYQLLIEIESMETRDRYVPDSGPTEEFQQWYDATRPLVEDWRQYTTTIPGVEGSFTDYHDVTG